tara:strand:- start:402 stop:815 length:414 start_codon:yes stop_codon:yes gene_type:complete
MKKAWQDPAGVIRDIAQGDPVKSYHPDVAAFYTTDVPDDAVNGATLVAGVWTNPPPPTPPTEAEIAAQEAARLVVMTAEAAVVVRATRTSLLVATDWRAVSDLVLSNEWATYRQALRDVTDQADFPNEIAWPTQPEN